MRTTRPRYSSSPVRAFSNYRSSRHRATALAAIILLSLCGAAPSWAQQPTPAYLAARPGFRPKDFTILRDGAWYHAFYIETDDNIPGDIGTRFGHSRSADLWHWEYLDSNFGPGTATFDNQRVWAPHLVKVSGVYYLFYTGVSNAGAQSIGVATSTDLSTWNRLSAPIMDCSIADNSECLPYGQLRDPFAMADPTVPGRWVTYYGTVFDGGEFMTTGMATTSSALTTTPWSDAGITWTPSPMWPFNEGKVESPHLFVHSGLWYLLYTSNAGHDQITVWTNATAPIGAEGSWFRRGRLHDVLGYSSDPWFASEKFDDVDGNEYLGVVSDLPSPRRIQIRRLTWTPGDWKFGLAMPPAGITAIDWDTETATLSVTEGQYANLVFTSGAFQGRQAHVEIVEEDPGQPDQILSPASLGLSADINLTGTSTTFNWTSQTTPDDDSTPNRLEIRVRLTNDHSVFSPLLYVNIPDDDPPAAVTNLAASPIDCESIDLTWTAPGDDGNTGTATEYRLVWATTQISTDAAFDAAFNAGHQVFTTAPGPPGTAETATYSTPGQCGLTRYFAIKTRDEVNNWSSLAYIATATSTPCPPPRQWCASATRPHEEGEGLPVRTELGAPQPNPTRGAISLRFAVAADARGSDLDLSVFDVSGRRTAMLKSGSAETGLFDVQWDLTAESGRRASTGLYFVRLRVGTQLMTKTLVIVP